MRKRKIEAPSSRSKPTIRSKLLRNKYLPVCTVFVFLVVSAILTFQYYSLNFTGTVLNKYVREYPLIDITLKSDHVVIKYWLGNKDFVIIDNEDFNRIKVGKEYSFQKDFWADWLVVNIGT